MKNRSVSITGATGFVGWHLCEKFAAAGWQVRAIVRPGNRKPLPPGIRAVEAPLDRERLSAAFAATHLVVHSAAAIRAPSERAFRIANVEGTRAVIDAANRAGARLVHLSSQAAIGPGTPQRPSREDDPPRPVNSYGRSKLESESVVRQECRGPWTILRPCAVYGPRDRGFLPLFRLARRGVVIAAAPLSTSFTFLFIDDLVRAIELAATDDRAVGETFFVGHPEPQPVEALMRALAEAYRRRFRLLRVPPVLIDLLAGAGEVSWKLGWQPTVDRGRLAELRAVGFVCSVERIRERIGFEAAMPFCEGIDRTARWYREEGW
jgi:nucleoside-diphosphate-sugar epimerase